MSYSRKKNISPDFDVYKERTVEELEAKIKADTKIYEEHYKQKANCLFFAQKPSPSAWPENCATHGSSGSTLSNPPVAYNPYDSSGLGCRIS